MMKMVVEAFEMDWGVEWDGGGNGKASVHMSFVSHPSAGQALARWCPDDCTLKAIEIP